MVLKNIEQRTKMMAEEMMMDQARASLIPCLCTRFTRAGIEWRR